MPVTYPSYAAWNRTPTSIGTPSVTAGLAGVAVGEKTVAAVTAGMVVNDQLVAAIAFPATSVAPLTVAAYVVWPLRGDDNWSVAVRVSASYVTVPGITLFAASRSTNDSVAGSIGSLNVTRGDADSEAS